MAAAPGRVTATALHINASPEALQRLSDAAEEAISNARGPGGTPEAVSESVEDPTTGEEIMIMFEVILTSFPGVGPLLGAEFLVAVGDLAAFASADHLAAYAGLVPAARDSGKRSGNHRRMRGGNKLLKKVLYQSAFSSLRRPASRAFYERKRREGKRHQQALIALARRRVNVLWAMLRDGTTFESPPLRA